MGRRLIASVRERVALGMNVRVGPLADAVGVAPATVHAWINDGKLEAIRFERAVMVPAHAAAKLLGMQIASTQGVAA